MFLVFSNICFGNVGLQAADMARYQATRPNQYMCSLSAAAWKESVQCYGGGWSEAQFLFSTGRSIFLGIRSSYFLSEVSGNCYSFEFPFILFYFIFFFLLISTHDKFSCLKPWLLVLVAHYTQPVTCYNHLVVRVTTLVGQLPTCRSHSTIRPALSGILRPIYVPETLLPFLLLAK